jgi:hypothetical protein
MLTPQLVRRSFRLAWLIVRAWLALIAVDLVLPTGFRHVHERLRRCQTHEPRRNDPALVIDVVWAVDEACVWYAKRAACLQRSVVATWLLRRRGIAAALVIGYRSVPFESHAWVEVDGRVVNDRPQYQRLFRVLDRL